MESREECTDLYFIETKQQLHKSMARRRRANSSGQDSVDHLHLKNKGHSFGSNDVHVLDRDGLREELKKLSVSNVKSQH